jgi:hypothetical protein
LPYDRGRAVTVERGSACQAGEPGRRLAVAVRAQRRELPGGCDQPASACEVHHVTHLADGGKTSVDGCALYVSFTIMSPSTSWAGPSP